MVVAHIEDMALYQFVAFGGFQVFPDHFADQFGKGDLRGPAQIFLGLCSGRPAGFPPRHVEMVAV